MMCQLLQDHPQRDHVGLVGEVIFPNLTLGCWAKTQISVAVARVNHTPFDLLITLSHRLIPKCNKNIELLLDFPFEMGKQQQSKYFQQLQSPT